MDVKSYYELPDKEMTNRRICVSGEAYRNVFLVQSRDYWENSPFDYNQEKDLVLSFDFALVEMIRQGGGQAYYLDHITRPERLEEYNHKTYDFFSKWHFNNAGQDIFAYQGIDN